MVDLVGIEPTTSSHGVGKAAGDLFSKWLATGILVRVAPIEIQEQSRIAASEEVVA
jgi:hypothetical protein